MTDRRPDQRGRSSTGGQPPPAPRQLPPGLEILSLIFSYLLILATGLFFSTVLEAAANAPVRVGYEGKSGAGITEIRRIYPQVKKEVEETLQWKLSYSPEILLYQDSRKFRKLVNSDIVVAVAVPQRRLIVIDYQRTDRNPFALRSTLKHEVSHLVLHDHIEGSLLPRWLDEGVSQWISDGVSELLTNMKSSSLNNAVLSGRIIPLVRLDGSFRGDPGTIALAYAESKNIVEFIRKKYGSDGILSILRLLGQGKTINEAVEGALKIPLHELGRRWMVSLKREDSLITFVSNYIYEILFLFAALLTIVGFVRLVIKRRQYRDTE